MNASFVVVAGLQQSRLRTRRNVKKRIVKWPSKQLGDMDFAVLGFKLVQADLARLPQSNTVPRDAAF